MFLGHPVSCLKKKINKKITIQIFDNATSVKTIYKQSSEKKKKKKKKITIQIFDKATSVKTIYKQSLGTGMPSHVPAQP